MQNIMYLPKCHSFSNIIMLFLDDGQGKVAQDIHQHYHYVIFLSTVKCDCKIFQILVGRQLLPHLVLLCVFYSSPLLYGHTRFTYNNKIKTNREFWGQNTSNWF